MKTFHEIENALRDYNWMTKEVTRLTEELKGVNAKLTAQYGIEATMPKSDGVSNPTETEYISKERKQKTLDKFKKKIEFIGTHSSCIEDDRQLTVLNCMLDGMSIVSISQHMGFSERKIYTIKDEIVRNMKENAEKAGYAGIAG